MKFINRAQDVQTVFPPAYILHDVVGRYRRSLYLEIRAQCLLNMIEEKTCYRYEENFSQRHLEESILSQVMLGRAKERRDGDKQTKRYPKTEPARSQETA